MALSSYKQVARRLGALSTTNSGVLVYVTLGNVALRMISSICLTRLLMPEAFGIVAIIGSIFYIVYMMTDLGFTAYVVRDERGDDPHFINVLWTLHAARGVLLMVGGMALAPLLAKILDKPSLTWPAAVAMTTLAISGLQSFGSITALRHNGARRLALFDFGATVIQLVINVLLAIAFRNVWALIASLIIQSVLKTVLSFYVFDAPAPRFVRDAAIIRDFLSFSKLVASSSVITLLMAQTDKLVLARLFTLSEFGVYGIAVTLAMSASGFADTYITRVVYPKYTIAFRTEPDTLARLYYTVRRSQSFIYALFCGGMIGSSHLIIAILYDPRYIGAAAYLSILMIGSLFRLPNFAAAELIMAMGSYEATLRSNIIRLAWVIVGGIVGYIFLGAFGVVVAVGTVEVAALGYLWIRLARIKVLDWRQEAAFIAVALAGAVVGYAISIAAHAIWFKL